MGLNEAPYGSLWAETSTSTVEGGSVTSDGVTQSAASVESIRWCMGEAANPGSRTSANTVVSPKIPDTPSMCSPGRQESEKPW